MATSVPARRYSRRDAAQKTGNVREPEQISNEEEAAVFQKVLSLAHQKRTLQAAGYLSVRHTLPKTRLRRAILLENKSQSLQLDLHLQRLSTRQSRFATNHEFGRRAFIDHQQRKQGIWKQQDEAHTSGMNFPNFGSGDTARRRTTDVLYRSPRYPDQESTDRAPPGSAGNPEKPLLPYMHLRRERTELLRSNDQTFYTRLPTIIEINLKQKRKYHNYCRPSDTDVEKPTADDRFGNVLQLLSPNKIRTSNSSQSYRIPENLTCFVHNRNAQAATKRSPDKRKSTVRAAPTVSTAPRRRVTIVCPSRSNAAALPAHQLAGESKIKSLPRSPLQPKKTRIKEDLKNKDMRELKKSYGNLSSRMEGDTLPSAAAASRASSSKSFSYTLKREFTVESNTK